MSPPADRLTYRQRPAAVGTEITLLGGRREELARSNITVNDLVVGVARHVTADCSVEQTISSLSRTISMSRVPSWHAFSAHHQTEWQQSGLAVRRGGLAERVLTMGSVLLCTINDLPSGKS